jgi:hypothetical protein
MTRRAAKALGGAVLAAVLTASGGCASAASSIFSAGPTPPGWFEVVGRGPVESTHSADVWVFEGLDGRDYAYTTTWGVCRGCVGDRMYVWDVTDPTRPVLTDSVVVDARVVNDVTVNADATLAVITREHASSRRNGVVLLDIADAAHPVVLTEYSESLTGGVHTTFIEGSHLYAVHNGTADLHVIDISNPRDPVEVARWGIRAHPAKYLHDVWVEDGLAYLSYWDDGLIVLDVGNGIRGGSPGEPVFVSQARYRYQWQGREYGNTHMAVPYTNAEGRRYVFVGDEIFPQGWDVARGFVPGGYLHVFDVTDVERPVEVAWYRLPEAGTHNIWIHDDVLYLAYYNAGLRALDVSGTLRGDLLRQGREIAALATTDSQALHPDRPFAMTPMWHKGHVFTVDFNSGLWVTRLHRTGNPAAAPRAR